MKKYIKILYLFLFGCSSIEDKPDSVKTWAYLDHVPIYSIQRDGSGVGYMDIIDTTRKEISIYRSVQSIDILEKKSIYRNHLRHLSEFRIALLALPNLDTRFERNMEYESVLIEQDIRNMNWKEYRYPGLRLHIMDEFNPGSMNIIAWNMKGDSLFHLVLDYNFKEQNRNYLNFPYKNIDIQRFSVSDSGNYLAIIYYAYKENDSDTRIDVFQRNENKMIKIHSFLSNPYEVLRELFFSRDERYLYLSDIESGELKLVELGNSREIQLVYDPKTNLDWKVLIPFCQPIPGRGNEILIRQNYTWNPEKGDLLGKEKMKIIRFSPGSGVLNEYTVDVPVTRYQMDTFLNDSTFLILEESEDKSTCFWREYNYDINNGFQLKKTVPYKLLDRSINHYSYLIFNGRGRWFKN